MKKATIHNTERARGVMLAQLEERETREAINEALHGEREHWAERKPERIPVSCPGQVAFGVSISF